MIADPFTTLHCCIRSDGGGAVVLTTEERARDCAKAPVWVLGTGEATSHTTMSEWDDFTESPARRARAGSPSSGPASRPPTSTSASSTTRSRRWCCSRSRRSASARRARAAPFVEDGKLRVGGALPTNTDGGGLSPCHPGMRGMFLLVEAVRQLRGEADGRQVADAELACVNGTGGWFSSASTVLLGVD